MGPVPTPANGHQFTLVGNAVYEQASSAPRQKWGITVHGSHHGLITDNVVYNVGGAGFVAEDGSESYNLYERNFAVRIAGEGSRLEDDASEGVGFWFRGPNNYVRDNVATNMIELSGPEAAYGFKFNFVYLGDIRVPNFKGADTSVAGQYTTLAGNAMPLLEMVGNETYGVIADGLTYLVALHARFRPHPGMPAQHGARHERYGTRPATATTAIRPAASPSTASWSVATRRSPHPAAASSAGIFFFGDYMNKDLVVRNADVQGIKAFILPYFGNGTATVEDSFLRVQAGVTNRTSGAPGSCPGCDLPERTQIIRNVRFGALPGAPLRSISMDHTTHGGSADLANRDEVFVYDYQGEPNNNFRVYYHEQATQNIAGGLAPCTDTTTHPEIDGITCPLGP